MAYFEYGHSPMVSVSIKYEHVLWVEVEMNKAVLIHVCTWGWNVLV